MKKNEICPHQKNFISQRFFSVASPQMILQAGTSGQSMIDVAQIDSQRILKAADTALKQKPITITSYHAQRSSGGLHDYYSNADYWWPDPKTPDGLPYVNRDGQTNPNNFNEHRKCIWQLRDAVTALGAAYKITGDDRYVKRVSNCSAHSSSIPPRG